MKKSLSSLTIAASLLLSAGAAFADNDNRVADHRFDDRTELAFKPGPDFHRETVIDAQRAFGRRGTVTLDVRRGDMKKNMLVVSSDERLDIRFVRITYANGRSMWLRGSRGNVIDLPDGGRIDSVTVSYVNRGARGAMIKLVAKGGNGGGGFNRPWRSDRRSAT